MSNIFDENGNIHFDVVMSNPPYQITINEKTKQGKPIYPYFIDAAKSLNANFIDMIIPSKWFSGGLGLDKFRQKMMSDKSIVKIVDYSNAKACFPDASIGGGVCYFLMDDSHDGKCRFVNINGDKVSESDRYLDEFDVVVRYNKAISIINKIESKNEEKFTKIVSQLMPFGLSSDYRGVKEKSPNKNIALYSSKDITYISKDELPKTSEFLNKYKIFLSKVGAEHAGEPSKDGKYNVITSSVKVVEPNTACTHSYFVIGANDDISHVQNVLSYIKTKFVRF